VDAEEIGRLIGDLENRVERLRSLYEQYFMGIERIEPLTARKDVDRRLWALRREQIRNTGLRFKLETTVQRYNTYQQYWQRIVREIEAGTYQRDLGRAAQRFGDNAVTGFAKRRQKMFEKNVSRKAERDALRRPGAEPSQAPPGEAGDEASPVSTENYDVTFEESDTAAPAPPQPPPAPVSVPEPIEPLELDIGGTSRPPPLAAPTVPTLIAEQRRGPPPPPLGALGALRAPGAPAASPQHAPLASSSGQGGPVLPRPAARPAPPTATAKAPTPPASQAQRAPTSITNTRPATSVAMPAKPSGPVPTPAKPAVPPPAALKPLTPPVAPARPAAPVPQPASPAQRAPAPSRPDAPAPAVLRDDNSLSPIRMRQIYGAFVEAKRKANESTAAVTYEKIATNLENVARELRAKHKARSVDFEVVMKNGKPVLKPVVKS
jgi:hypothetical protein